MLVLSRKVGDKIFIGDNIAITVVRIGPNTVRIGIECPREINIVREELGSQHIDVEVDDETTVENVARSIEIAHLEQESR